jgi:hypothetical protein
VALAELLLRRGEGAAAASVVAAGIESTHDADGRLHHLRAAVEIGAKGGADRAIKDLEVAIDRAARPGSDYLLRAAIRLEFLDDVDGAMADLASFVEWSTPDEVETLRTDPRFEDLRPLPRFERLLDD